MPPAASGGAQLVVPEFLATLHFTMNALKLAMNVANRIAATNAIQAILLRSSELMLKQDSIFQQVRNLRVVLRDGVEVAFREEIALELASEIAEFRITAAAGPNLKPIMISGASGETSRT